MRKFSLTAFRGRLLLLLLMVCTGIRMHAQTDISIGTGTAGNTGTNYPTPLQDWYEGGRAQFLYLASELNAAGIGAGNINAIKFNVTGLNTFSGDIQQLIIKIDGTVAGTLNTAATGWENVNNTVYGPVDYTPTVGINTFTFTTPYFWNGADNIVIEICNGLPGNTSDGAQHFTQNVTVPWTTGLSFNGSHSIGLDNTGSLCGSTLTSSITNTTTNRPNITFNWTPAAACTGTPTGGTAIASITSACSSVIPFTVSVNGATSATGITFQWQDSTQASGAWKNITNATSATYSPAGIGVNTYFRRKITCGVNSSYSSSVFVAVTPPAYAPLPFTEGFESGWLNVCDTRDVPNNFWRNAPSTGNNSWRRNDDGAAANWSSTSGAYTPESSAGSFSARFHSFNASSGSRGRFDLFVNCNTPAVTKSLSFDYINTSGNDSLVIYLSTNGGATFTRLDSVRTSGVWKTKTLFFNATSATCVLRFEAVSDFGGSDIGLDNLRLVDFPNCTGTPVGGAAVSTLTSVCGPTIPFTLSVNGATFAGALTYQWQDSTQASGAWANITNATAATYTPAGIAVNTAYRRIITCSGSSSYSVAVLVTVTPPAYAALPFTESFENTWASICDTRDAPNNFWRNSPGTGNNSWRRNDDGASGNWTSTAGAYTPESSAGTYSARFHSFNASSGTRGRFDLFVNCSTPDITKALTFDYINTTGNDSLVIYFSTNGGTTFTRVDSVRTSAVWKTKTIFFNTTSATTVVRFEAVSDFGGSDIGLDNIRLVNFPTCTGTPVGGTAASTLVSVCNAATPFTLSVNGATFAGGLTYQWQRSADGNTWTNITTNGTGLTYNATGISASTWFRRQITCSGNSSFSDAVFISFTAPAHAALPYTESFETWASVCDVKDVPNNYWRNNPVNGNNAWRRDDEGASAGWSSLTLGGYTPVASDGLHSARFHAYSALNTTKSQLDLYINASTAAALKRLSFDYINTSGNDSLIVYLSTNGGTSFTRLDTVRTTADWNTKAIFFTSSSATTIIRFEAVDASSTTDIGLDNVLVIDWSDCSGKPAGGTATSSATTVCSESFKVSVTGASTGNGIKYQWQRSTDNTNWSNTSAVDTSLSMTTAQTVTTWYRVVTSCTLSGLSDTSVAVQVISPVRVNGLFYTIDNNQPTGGLNFHTFNDAYNFIKCGINGPVLFTVKTGINNNPYNEQLIMGPVPGASAINTVTFKGNGVAAIGFGSTNSDERAVIKLKGTKHIIFDNLVILANTGTYGYGVQLMSNTDSNTVKNCIINSSLTSTTENYAGIVINGSDAGPVSTGTVLSDDNIFSGNTITGGYYGFTLVASYNGGGNGRNQFINNQVKDFYRYGIYVAGSYKTLIERNTFSRPARTDVGAFTGIYFTTQDNTACMVSKNRISNPFGGAPASTADFYGIYFNNSDADVADADTVSNNLIFDVNGNGAVYGIANTGSNHTYYLHNTISLDEATATSAATTRGFYNTGTTTGLAFYNNIISITRGGTGDKHCIYLNSNLPFADNNDYYINAAGGNNYIGYYNNVSYPGIVNWKAAVSASPARDQASLMAIPAFVDRSAGNYAPGNAGIDNKGLAIGIGDDILNQPRHATTPDIGAFEFTPPPCSTPPVNGYTIVTPDTICQYNPVYLTMNIGAFGSAQTFQWQAATTLAGPYTAIGGPKLTPDTTILANTSLYLRVAIGCGSSLVYSDTVHLVVNPALPAGTYTISKDTATNYIAGNAYGNFNSFADAKAAMGCGIGGAVVFNVVAGTGPYTEQLILDSIAGTSASRTITFNGNGNTLTFNMTNAGEKAVIKLNGADHIIFDSLVIDAGTGTYGFGVQLINNADSNIFRRNTIRTSSTATGTDFAGIVLNSSAGSATSTGNTWCDGNLFDANTITGGYYGITLVGSTTASNFINDNKVTNNTISEFYNYGLYATGTINTLISGNTFTRPARTSVATNVYGIYLSSAPSPRINISGNRFTKFFGGAPASTTGFYGIAHNAVDAAAGGENIISNNLFYGLDGRGVIYPLHNTGSNNVWYYHNAISIDNDTNTAATASAGFYQTTTATGLQFVNNIISVTRGGTGNKHGIYLNATASEVMADRNDYYVTGTNAHVGYYSANRTSLADWMAAAGKDANSASLNPLYTAADAGDLKPQLAAIDNKGTPVGILTDILGITRHASTPDIGAYEFAPQPCVNPPVAGAATVTPNSGVCLEVPIELNVTGHSPLGSITFQWFASADNGLTWDSISPVQYFPQFNTVTTMKTLYRAAVTCNGSTTYTTTTQVTLNTVLLTGVYTIGGPAGPNNFATFQTAVDAMLCGITGPIVFNVAPGIYDEKIRVPYIPNTSPVNTVTFRSATGVAADVNLRAGGTATANYTLKLDSTKYFTFRDITITDTGSTHGRVVELANSASYDSIVHCIIAGPAVTTFSNNLSAVYANPVKGRNLVIRANHISGGSNGIYFAGTSTASLAVPGHSIDSNTVSNAWNHGIFVENVNRIRLVNNTVHITGMPRANTAGIYTSNADSASRITGNIVHVNDVDVVPVYGIYITNTRALMKDSLIVAANQVKADSGNTAPVYGLTINGSKGISVVNNVIGINSAGITAYGLYHLNNADEINYYNNTVNLLTNAPAGYAGYFAQTATGGTMNVRNNIFSNKGGGRSLYVTNPALFSADYNMLYSNGDTLVKVATGTATGFTNLATWKNTWNWDHSSISFAPAFVGERNLRPDLNNPDVWAMHGRGVQVKGNTYDFNNRYRPDSLTAGVPDLGAFEFYPLALPTVLTAVPATPAANTTQLFHYGSDTVMKITWGASAPASIDIRRYSGVVPSGLLPGTDSMFFYTKVDIPGGSNYNYAAKLYYVDSWQGSIPRLNRIGLGRTTPSNAWVVGANSKVDVKKKEISQEAIAYLDRFTGLVNPFAQPESEDSSSNRGKDFWVGYQRTNGFTSNAQTMVLYFGAGEVPANVTVSIEGTSGTPWVKNYFVPANSALTSEEMPETGPEDARLITEGFYSKKGIHITSDVPIVAYAHIFENTNSGATMLMPTAVWGYEYYTLSSRQYYTTTGSASVYHVIAQHDSTWVEINPSRPTVNGWVPNGGTQPNGSYLVKLNKGDAYQVLGAVLNGSEGYDLSGSYVKSIGNAQGQCFPIGVFAGSTRTAIGCGTNTGSNGDLILQQIFPYQAWGNKYITAPTSNDDGPSATSHMGNIYRIMVKDTATIVKVNHAELPRTLLINKRYYQYESNTADYIEANQPILVAQYMASSGSNCSNMSTTDGDPEMFYLSPLQQAIKSSQFYRNDQYGINSNFLTLVIPTEGLPSLKIDGIHYLAYPTAERYAYTHTNLAGYTVVTKRWAEGSGSSTVESELPFTGIVYGLGSAESYGYNVGTLVKNLNNLSTVDNVYNTGNDPTEYTCKGAPFKVTALLPLVPQSILWQFSQVPNLKPNKDSLQQSPVPVDTVNINGIDYYAFTLEQNYVFDTAGILRIPIKFTSPFIEKCDNTQDGAVIVQILPSPATDFKVNFPGPVCEGATATFTGDQITQNGIALSQWNWTFHNSSTATGPVQSMTYPAAGSFPVKLSGITADGCVSDTTKQVVINANPVVTVSQAPVCQGSDAEFKVNNPDAGSTYNWYNTPAGGTPVGTGASITIPGISGAVNYYVQQTSAAGCTSTMTDVKVTLLPPLATPLVRVDTVGTDMVRFAWTAVTGAASYEVSVDGGTTWTMPSSGATGLTHTMNGLQPLQTVTIIVKAKGCDEKNSAPLSQQILPDGIFIPNAFTPNGDGLNDVLKVYSYKIKEMQFLVFNQWGEKIFESRNQSMAWDGSFKGKIQASGVYMYVCKMTLTDGTVVNKKGSVNLIR